ncbi:MAG TPA: ATP-binding protein [Thermoanaerobaculia bacterium]|nr:ATP-binding protein [Thermoanaerobaculia bacterium]
MSSPSREPAWLALLEVVLVAALVAAPALPAPWSAAALLVLSIAWLAMRRSRERRIAGPILAVAVGVLAAGWAYGRLDHHAQGEWVRETRQAYSGLWKDLRAEAVAAAKAVAGPAETPAATLAAFSRLAEIEVGEGMGRRALLLLDPDGVPVAWAGEGLLHELSQEVPRSGLFYRASFSAVTLLAVHPLDGSRRPWRVVAGASFPSDVLPFPGGRRARWTLVDGPAQAVRGTDLVTLQGAPALVVEKRPAAASSGWPPADRLAWALIGLALLSIAVLRFLRVALPGGGPLMAEDGPVRRLVSPFAVGGLIAFGAAMAVPSRALGVLLAGLAVASIGVWARSQDGDRVPAWVKGAGAILMLLGAAWALQRLWGPLDLAGSIFTSAEAFTLRVGFAGAAFGLLCLAGRRKGSPAALPFDRVAWASVALLLAGAALCDQPLLAVPLLAAGGAAAASYADQRRLGEGLALVALILMSVFAAAGIWETAHRWRLREYAGKELLARLSPPTRQENAAVSLEIRRHFGAIDLARVVPRSPGGLERQDLAYALWKDSPLARHHSLSALVVQTDDAPPSFFSFGMPLTDQGLIDPEPTRWEDLRLPPWEDFLISDVVPLRFAGKPWGRVRYWLQPSPGFEVHDWRRLSEVDVGLLKGGPVAGPIEEIAQPALYALYTPDGRASLSPWEEEPPLPVSLRQAQGGPKWGRMEATPSGPARAWARRSEQGWEVVYLPVLRPIEALERTGNWSLGVIALLALAAPPLLLLALPRAAFRDLLRRTVRSYSKRLMIVYTVLLLVPLVLLYFVLVRAMEERLRRDQRVAGEAALNSAQQVLGERLLTLPPGFGVDTIFGDRLLIDLSRIVRHEVNLYWGSAVHSSSRHELFTAGLLPKRIPGEIYRRLALLGYGLSSRTNRVGDTTYLEMYAPLRVPGGFGNERFFLSMPLLAQQEEAARQLAQLRRQGLLVTAGLFALLVAVGRRLARNFTRPLMELVEGTRRIAAGAPSLDLAPTELELALLVEAVDEMARRIAEARERLVREKQVVDRMVENITSGVVSLDRERRVLMHNRVAAELLGTEVGESLEEAVKRAERLRPVADFLSGLGGAGTEMARSTVRLAGLEGEGEREWALVWVPLPGSGEPSALLVVEDATEVLRGQRLLAWAEMARMIAHEIKNPLTPIRLSTEHMMEVYRHDPEHFSRVFERCTTNILTQVDELRSIASEFSTYSSIPRIDPKPADLVESMADLVEGYRAAPPPGISVDFEPVPGTLLTRFDAKLLHRAVRNLIENALRASAGGGRVVVRIEQTNGLAKIAVQDSGPGVPPDHLPRIFDPYFSTHDTGTGLGLPIARRIAEEHGGGITARNRPEGGLEVVVTLPV